MAALVMNSSKRSLFLEIKQQDAKDALGRLIERPDVFVQSMRPRKNEAFATRETRRQRQEHRPPS
jgi:crotonobetainyl-CoA:carnitine CoA-transferase CaiB-like acyl-CoA transferase